jgi:uncharacterized protein YjiS (DUF1127 family)
MTSSIEYSAIWTASGGKAKYYPELNHAQTFEEIVVAAHATRGAVIAGAFARLGGAVKSGLRKFAIAQKRRAAASQLMAMDDRMLRDIGLTRGDVPIVVCGLASGEAPDVFANAETLTGANQANENSRNHAA